MNHDVNDDAGVPCAGPDTQRRADHSGVGGGEGVGSGALCVGGEGSAMVTSVVLHRRDTSPTAKLSGGPGAGRRLLRVLVWFIVLSVVWLLFLLTKSGETYPEAISGPTRLLSLDDFGRQPSPSPSPSPGPTAQTDLAKVTTQEAKSSDSSSSRIESSRGFLVFTSGCKIPDLLPMDPAVKKFVKLYAIEKEKYDSKEDSEKVAPNCSREFGPALVESNLTSLYLIPSALPHYNITNVTDLNCCFRPFYRVMADPEKYDYSADSKFEYNETCVPFGEDGTVSVGEEEFVRVECRFLSDDPKVPMFYKDFHSFVSLRVARQRAEEQLKAWDKPPPEPRDDKWSVLILGVDAVSRLNFHRQMPKTKAVLDSIGAVEFLGYNKVADNTFPNIVPLMTGYTEDELKTACWPTPKKKLDDCPWLWYNFTAEGYMTLHGEDCSWMSIFNYVKAGFLKQPTHFYLRPFAKVAEDENGHMKRMNAKVCVGPRMTVQLVLGYTEKLIKTLSFEPGSKPLFGLTWVTSLTHDYLNSAGYLDEPQARLISDIAATGALNRTVLFFISDHGIRWGGIRETYQGKLEERLPFVYAVLPPSLRERYPSAVANLRRNAKRRLTTPFDLHATLADLLRPDLTMADDVVAVRSKDLPTSVPKGNVNGTIPRGISLFLPIPEWRTCEAAGVSANWCGCHAGEKPIETDDPLATASASVVVDKVNEFLDPYPQCAKRTMVGVKNAVLSTPPDTLLPDSGKKVLQDVSLVVESNPGSALFEATVRLTSAGGVGTGVANTTYRMNVVGTISRINRYGNQSVCVDEFHMKLYCYCGS
ncbi:uncharacterized protein [Hetaerina americana]|uniref:uncharacterized protein n=1 Tax=Hetaerina americana TaxID=62018 RepID=UPI003A7F44A7